MTKAEQLKKDEAIASLKELIEPGDTVYTKLIHRSKSGMYRAVDVYVIKDNVPLRLSWSVALATESGYDTRHEGVRAGGCGLDVGFALVYALSCALFRKDGFTCIGKGCPSNDHNNGERNYEPHVHSDPGYALNHRWL
mgnify:FL=1